jgi:NADPH-dependent F420 reductase
MDVAIVGGTGAEGFGLGLRLATAGHRVIIGSRAAERGAEAADRASALLAEGAQIEGTSNEDSVAAAEAVAVTVPFAGQAEIYRSIKGAVRPGTPFLDATSPLATAVGGRPWQVLTPWHGSAAQQAQALLGSNARVVAGLHTIAAHALQDLEIPIESDVLVAGDDPEAKSLWGALIEDVPNLRWVDCGRLESARIAETLTALLISVNRAYKVKDAGFRIVGRDTWGAPS